MLAQAMGINRPSLPAAFGTKDKILRAVLKRYTEGALRLREEALALPDTASSVWAYLEGTADNITADGTRRGCLATIGEP